ncbi:glycosyltransferase [Hymenobacter arizonensis]|uniref:Glycosyltransferase involved in cell wall bisynthesis n=1 Tax=Hymenobacter arizonensis TaxID=1227077 RepID=A0A1I5YRC3_HYMAR|nr:glycosyltransferase [Hymenobacter arizonensis]SFQ46781.1 Glycosyltransferase involved in cell wall bisynthesis [Hymenobacter arizonensis]
MRILFLSYWGLNDGLTTSTVFPHLRLLQERTDVTAILLVTIERGADAQAELLFEPGFEVSKITFEPLRSRPSRNVLVNKIEDFTRFPRTLIRQVEEFKPDFLLARGAPAGALAYLVWQKTKLPFYVESFEPHADYMLESGVWRSYDPRYLFQRHWETKQKQLALGLMPVAENYRQQLIAEGVPAQRIATVPCSVDAGQFAYNGAARQRVRESLGWAGTDVVGVYVGKFGSIYYDEEAFQVFRTAADFFGADFRLVILTPDPLDEVQAKLAAAGVSAGQTFVTKAAHQEVPDYLSAADFAFATIKPAPCRLFCSAIKIGEYWASGLPVLLPEGIGDDSDIIKREGGGAIFNLDRPSTVSEALANVAQQMAQPGYRQQVRHLAERHRSIELSRQAYTHFFGVPALQ